MSLAAARDENVITNDLFFARHPELPRIPLRRDQTALAREWVIDPRPGGAPEAGPGGVGRRQLAARAARDAGVQRPRTQAVPVCVHGRGRRHHGALPDQRGRRPRQRREPRDAVGAVEPLRVPPRQDAALGQLRKFPEAVLADAAAVHQELRVGEGVRREVQPDLRQRGVPVPTDAHREVPRHQRADGPAHDLPRDAEQAVEQAR